MPLGDVDLEEFRSQAHRLADWITAYLGRVETLPVLPRVRPGELRAALPPAPPSEPEPLARILDDVDRVLVPGLTHWNHPGFLAYFAINCYLLYRNGQTIGKRLLGIRIVRTDGSRIFAARRVNAGFQFETYGPSPAAP